MQEHQEALDLVARPEHQDQQDPQELAVNLARLDQQAHRVLLDHLDHQDRQFLAVLASNIQLQI
jgi:hypothetical protein